MLFPSAQAPVGTSDRTFMGVEPVCDYQLPYGLTMFTNPLFDSDLCGNEPLSCGLIPGIPFTRKCVAQPQPWRRFVCYDMDPTLDVDELIADYVEFANNLTSSGVTPTHVGTKAYGWRVLDAPLFTNVTSEVQDIVRFGIFADWDVQDEDEWEFERRVPPEHPGFPNCMGGCAFHEFCGRDGQCHERSCQNIYDFAPYEMVNYNASYPKGELICTDNELQSIDVGVECKGNQETEWPIAAFFQCQVALVLDPELDVDTIDLLHDTCWSPDLDNRYIPFDRMCTSTNPDQQFECYEVIDPLGSSRTYLQAVAAFDGQCSADTLNPFYRDEVFAGQNDLVTSDSIVYGGRSVYGSCHRDLVYQSDGWVGSERFCDLTAGPYCASKVETGRLDYLVYSQVKLTSSAWRTAATVFGTFSVMLVGWAATTMV